jgi:hypothetical protein
MIRDLNVSITPRAISNVAISLNFLQRHKAPCHMYGNSRLPILH